MRHIRLTYFLLAPWKWGSQAGRPDHDLVSCNPLQNAPHVWPVLCGRSGRSHRQIKSPIPNQSCTLLLCICSSFVRPRPLSQSLCVCLFAPCKPFSSYSFFYIMPWQMTLRSRGPEIKNILLPINLWKVFSLTTVH